MNTKTITVSTAYAQLLVAAVAVVLFACVNVVAFAQDATADVSASTGTAIAEPAQPDFTSEELDRVNELANQYLDDPSTLTADELSLLDQFGLVESLDFDREQIQYQQELIESGQDPFAAGGPTFDADFDVPGFDTAASGRFNMLAMLNARWIDIIIAAMVLFNTILIIMVSRRRNY